MKKLILAVLAAGSFATAEAQKPGSILVYGDLGLAASKAVTDPGIPGTSDIAVRSTDFNITVGGGYQFNKCLTAGLHIGYGGGRNKSDATIVEGRYNDFQVGAFLRSTAPINRTFFVYSQLNLTYLFGNDIMEAGPLKEKDIYNGFGATVFPGVGINVTRCVALNFSVGGLGYGVRRWDFDSSPATLTESGFGLTFGRQFNLGVTANLGGKTKAHKRNQREPKHQHHIDVNAYEEDED